MVDNNLYDGDEDGRYLYNALINDKRKVDNKLIIKIGNLSILQESSNSNHFKEIKKLNLIRLALKMGALVFSKFPNLTNAIIIVMNEAKSEGQGRLYLEAVAREIQKAYDELLGVEQSIEADIQV